VKATQQLHERGQSVRPFDITRNLPAPPDAVALNFGEARLDALQRHSFEYFLRETNPENGLVADKSLPGSPASIAAVGFALAAYPVGVERGWMTRTDALAGLESPTVTIDPVGSVKLKNLPQAGSCVVPGATIWDPGTAAGRYACLHGHRVVGPCMCQTSGPTRAG